MSENSKDILGRGWEFPPRFDKTIGGVTMLEGKEDVQNSIEIIIHTKFGERILRGEFGSTIHELLFETLDENMKTRLSDSLELSLELNEPRITVKSITLNQPNPHLGRVDISIVYQIIETNETDNMVVPFYTPDNLSITGLS